MRRSAPSEAQRWQRGARRGLRILEERLDGRQGPIGVLISEESGNRFEVRLDAAVGPDVLPSEVDLNAFTHLHED